jgi:general secretion pathway protein C
MTGLLNACRHPFSSDWQGIMKQMEVVRLPQIVFLLLLILLAWQLADLTWRIFSPAPAVVGIPVATQATAPSLTPQTRVDFTDIVNHHLFGKVVVARKQQAPRAVPKQAPVTRLNLVLYGVFTDKNPQQGGAIIGKTSADQRYYHIGESLGAATSLAEVHEDHIILNRSGQFEALYFPQAGNVSTKNIRRSGNLNKGRTVPAKSKRALTGYRDMLRNTPQKFMEHIQIVPVNIGGKLQGFRLLPKQDRALYNQLGVTAADVITAVNGISVAGDQPAISELMKELSEAKQLVITAMRRGREQTITVNLN